MLGGPNSTSHYEGSALAAKGPRHQQKKSRPWCEHCKKTGHTKDTCWFIHGKPADTKPPRGRENRGNIASTSMHEIDIAESETSVFSREQMELLQKLFQQTIKTDGTNSSTASMAQKGNIVNAMSVCKGGTTSWIVDSGASDHMTGNIATFSKYFPCHDNSIVRIADGTHSKVMGKGSVVISKDIVLKDVLYVPKLDCNLLSISKLTKDLNCVTKFHPYLCEFQALDSGKRIGNAKECAGLYLLQVDDSKRKPEKSACVVVSPKEEAVMLWHYRLGHPNFLYLKKMFPSIFNKSLNFFHCEICEMSKHTRNTYPVQPYKPSHPFSLIHSDVWGPSRVNTITGSRWFVTFIDDHTRVTWVFLMKEKSEVGKIFENFHNMVQTQFQTSIQVL